MSALWLESDVILGLCPMVIRLTIRWQYAYNIALESLYLQVANECKVSLPLHRYE